MSKNELVYSLLDYYPTHHSFPMSHIASKWERTFSKFIFYKSKTYMHVHVHHYIRMCISLGKDHLATYTISTGKVFGNFNGTLHNILLCMAGCT